MKKSIVKILALALVAVMMCAILVSCGGPSGKYEAESWGSGITLDFSGKNVDITIKVIGFSSEPIKGTYEIKDDKITISLVDDDAEDSLDKAVKTVIEKILGEQSYEKTDDGIKIGGVEYKKVD